MRDRWRPLSNKDLLTPQRVIERFEEGKKRVLCISGGTPLSGVIQVPGGKNIQTPALLAATLPFEESTFHNVSRITELGFANYVIQSVNAARINFMPRDNSSIKIYPNPDRSGGYAVPGEVGDPTHVSIVAAGAILASQGYADIPLPGGDRLGVRSLRPHLQGFEDMGVLVDKSNSGRICLSTERELQGATITLASPRITATETVIFPAVTAKGKTTIHNTSFDPEVEELIFFLNKAGAKIIRRTNDGQPTRTIDIHETAQLKGVEYTIPTDRSVVVTYAVAAVATKSKDGILIKGAEEGELHTFLSLLDEMGGGYEIKDDGIRFFYKGPLKAPKRTIISMNKPYLESDDFIGIYADWQPLVSILLLQAKGKSTLVETAHPVRFHHLRATQDVGADITYFNPREKGISVSYNFDETNGNSLHGAIINGGYPLGPLHIKGSDIRLGAFGLVLGLAIPDESTIEGIHQIERGYPDPFKNFKDLGATISVE